MYQSAFYGYRVTDIADVLREMLVDQRRVPSAGEINRCAIRDFLRQSYPVHGARTRIIPPDNMGRLLRMLGNLVSPDDLMHRLDCSKR